MIDVNTCPNAMNAAKRKRRTDRYATTISGYVEHRSREVARMIHDAAAAARAAWLDMRSPPHPDRAGPCRG